MLVEDMFKISVKPGVQLSMHSQKEFFWDDYNDLKRPYRGVGNTIGFGV
jgi:hypothetical protein